jgi:hypothetical protein
MSPRTDTHQSSPVRPKRRGFTLIEAALTTFIIGTAVLAIVQLFAACTEQNSVAAKGTTAMLLASHIQETMAGLPILDPSYANTYFGAEPGEVLRTFNDVDDFDGMTFNPPIDATRTPIPPMAQYSQVVSVVPVLANKLNSNTNPAALDMPKATYTGAVRVQVRIIYRPTPTAAPQEVYRASWLRLAQH